MIESHKWNDTYNIQTAAGKDIHHIKDNLYLTERLAQIENTSC